VIKMETMAISSNAFEMGGRIPTEHTCDGRDTSPPLSWESVPEGTQSLALIMDDPDAPAGTFVHWVIYNIPKDQLAIQETVLKIEKLTDGTMQGITDFRRIGYGGPCPPPGKPHRYYFNLYALDINLSLSPGATKAQLLNEMEGHILGKAQLMGTYER
jgi:Raf kinase inhibitor-like YbhB/YbcL family protein